MKERYLGCLLGLACGDAVGAAVEFMPRGSFPPVTGMIGGGPFGLRPGQWTDDTSMALCLAESLLEVNGFDPADQIQRYVRWWKEGHLSSTGECFDIGNTTADALQRYLDSGDPYSGSTHYHSAGNGSIMRLAPIPMYYTEDLEAVVTYSGDSSRTTHAAQEAVEACQLFGLMIALALRGAAKENILTAGDQLDLQLSPKIASIAAREYRQKPIGKIRGSGYVVASLEAALWVFERTDSYEEAVLAAVNLGEDTDTTAAVVGQLAGAYYGLAGLPAEWVKALAFREQIEEYALRLYQERPIP